MRNLFIGAIFISFLVAGCTAQTDSGTGTTLPGQTTISVPATNLASVTLEKINDKPITFQIESSDKDISGKQFYPEVKQVASAALPGYCLVRAAVLGTVPDPVSGKITGRESLWDYRFNSASQKKSYLIRIDRWVKYDSTNILAKPVFNAYNLTLIEFPVYNNAECMNLDNYIDSTTAAEKFSSSKAYNADIYVIAAAFEDGNNKWIFAPKGSDNFGTQFIIDGLTGELKS